MIREVEISMAMSTQIETHRLCVVVFAAVDLIVVRMSWYLIHDVLTCTALKRDALSAR